MKVLLGTHNEHKRRELVRMLPGWSVELLDASTALPPEDGETFAENALLKARAVARASGRSTIAEDSGIEAQALGGAPGIRSARYASTSEANARDAENTAKLRREAPAGSALRYVCALAFVDPVAGIEQVFHGCCRGYLAAQPSGQGGFGYDPVFVPEDVPGEVTMADLSDAQKDAISHRGKAARAMWEWFEERA